MNSKLFFNEMRKIIREEVQRAMKEIITESAVSPKETPIRQKSVQKQKVTIPDDKPKTLQQLLTETAEDMKNGTDDRTLSFTSADAESFGYGNMMKRGVAPVPTVDIEGRRVNTENLDPSVVEALTKDYSKLMKAMKEKKNK